MASYVETDAKGVGTSYEYHQGDRIEPMNQLSSFHYYSIRGKQNYLVVFNHFKYRKSNLFWKQPSERRGTACDAKRLRDVFEAMDFKVSVHTDLAYDQIMDEMQKVSSMDHTNTGCVTIVLLTHGESSGVVLAADREYQVDELWKLLSADVCPGLATKPKLFFIQACRGKGTDSGVKIDSFSYGIKIPFKADILIMYSTIEDYVSWRDTEGSWFIQALCDEIEANCERADILTILTLVNWRVAYTRSSFTPTNVKMDNMKQMPQIVSMLTKLLRLSYK